MNRTRPLGARINAPALRYRSRSLDRSGACGPRFRSQLYCAGYHQGAVLGAGGRDGCTSVVEAERSRTAQRGFAGPRGDRDVAARLSEGPVLAASTGAAARGD